MSSTSAGITKEQIEAYRQQCLRECQEKLVTLLAEHDCDLIAQVQIVDGRIVANVVLTTKRRE